MPSFGGVSRRPARRVAAVVSFRPKAAVLACQGQMVGLRSGLGPQVRFAQLLTSFVEPRERVDARLPSCFDALE